MSESALVLLGVLVGGSCDDGEVRLGPRPDQPEARDARPFEGVSPLERLLPRGTVPVVTPAEQARDVRVLLPRRKQTVRAGDRAFAVVPIGHQWQRVGWRGVQVISVGAGGDTTVRLEEGREVAGVPPALILGAPGERPRVGEAVRAGIGRSLPFGRVHRLDGERVVVRTVFLGEVREATLAPEEILRLPAGLMPGAPVVFRQTAGHRIGSLLVEDHKHWWVLGPDGIIHRVPWTDLKPLSMDHALSSGDAVRAALPMSLRTVTVTKVLDAGLRYEVGWDQTLREVVCFSALAPL